MNSSKKILCGSLVSLSLMTFALLEARSEVRKLIFPKEYPMGKLNFVIKEKGLWNVKPAATAIGEVTLKVPPYVKVELEVNPRCIEENKKLKFIPTEGIDNLKIGYMSMEEDDHVCDKALAAMPLFKNPITLDCFRTDVTDAGILSFKSLSKVNKMLLFMALIDGSFLKEYKQFQNIDTLKLSHNSLKPGALKNLKDLKNLTNLNLVETNLTDESLADVCKVKTLISLSLGANSRLTANGLKGLEQCTNLQDLNLSFLKNCTDDVIPTLQKLTHLTSLNLTRTKVTAAGLEKLKSLKLRMLKLPERIKVSEIEKLRKIFPNTAIMHGGEVSEDIQSQFAPLPK